MTSTHQFALIAVLSVALAPCANAKAEKPEFSASVTHSTDYSFREKVQTDNGFVIHGDFETADGRFYAVAWASSIEYGTNNYANPEYPELATDNQKIIEFSPIDINVEANDINSRRECNYIEHARANVQLGEV